MSNKAPWFFHSSQASNSPAMLEVRAEYGWEGYGLAWVILEKIASGEARTLPMEQLREFWLETKSDRMIFLGTLEILLTQGLVAKKQLRDEDLRMNLFHLFSPVLEEQLLNKQLQFMARVFEPRERVARPGIPRAIRAYVLAAGCCAYCGSAKELQVDHIYPYSKGGAHSIENFQALCRTCNFAKRDRTEEEYFALIGRTNG